jgi:hypothetical protein
MTVYTLRKPRLRRNDMTKEELLNDLSTRPLCINCRHWEQGELGKWGDCNNPASPRYTGPQGYPTNRFDTCSKHEPAPPADGGE